MDSLPITNASPLDNGHAVTKVCNPLIIYKTKSIKLIVNRVTERL